VAPVAAVVGDVAGEGAAEAAEDELEDPPSVVLVDGVLDLPPLQPARSAADASAAT
jgi:hypothetical protein